MDKEKTLRKLREEIEEVRKKYGVEFAEVVRCKDCIKRKTPDCSMYYEADGEQYSWEVDDDFCSCGERRGNNGNEETL